MRFLLQHLPEGATGFAAFGFAFGPRFSVRQIWLHCGAPGECALAPQFCHFPRAPGSGYIPFSSAADHCRGLSALHLCIPPLLGCIMVSTWALVHHGGMSFGRVPQNENHPAGDAIWGSCRWFSPSWRSRVGACLVASCAGLIASHRDAASQLHT